MEESKLRDFYAASDLIVSRASATVIFEIAAWGKPSILIPLRNSAQDHQRKNAYEYAAGEGAVVIEEANLSPHILFAEIKKVLANPAQIKKMSEAAQRFARIDSAEVIAREILKLGIH
jgi:UDP-N-acetylglucosamine--N-acetylmuramyl-(pentapeptide) pyrophosphoryl-undecaprenol N-acetylglucosamine transferase